MRDLVGRGYRVVGMVSFMVGAGFILESQAQGTGWLAMLFGLAAFVYGFILSSRDSDAER